MAFIINDEGFGIDIFIPKNVGIRDLLAMCAEYAEPVGNEPVGKSPALELTDHMGGLPMHERGKPVKVL